MIHDFSAYEVFAQHTPTPIFFRPANHQSFQFWARARSPGSAALAAIILLSDEYSMPRQQGLRCNKRGDFLQTPPPQAFRLGCQSTSLIVVESHSSVSELLAQNPVFLAQVLDRLQLALSHPASQGNHHELDWIKNFRHL